MKIMDGTVSLEIPYDDTYQKLEGLCKLYQKDIELVLKKLISDFINEISEEIESFLQF